MHTLALDNETYLMTREAPAPKVVCTSYCDTALKPGLFVGGELLSFWRAVLEDDEIQIVGHNLAYDTTTISATYPELLPLIFEKYRKNLVTDTMLRQQIWDIAVGRASSENAVRYMSLENLVEIILEEKVEGKHGPDVWRLRYAELDGVPLEKWPRAAVEYAQNDALYTYRVWDAQNEVQEQIRYEHERTYIAFVLRLIEVYGMRTNAEAVAQCGAAQLAIKNELEPKLIEAGLVTVNRDGSTTKKTKPAQERVIAGCTKNNRPVPLTKTGMQMKRKDPSFTWEKNPKMVGTDKVASFLCGDPLMMDRVAYGNAEKILSTYVPVLRAGIDGPITTSFGIAATGRTTSKAPRKPQIGTNFQNAPRLGGVRECYYPRPGYVYLAADFSGAELHTLAQVCKNRLGYSELGERLRNGEDVHLTVASQFLGLSYEEALRGKEEKNEDVLNARQDAKPANFGFPGGMGANTFIVTQIKDREKLWEYDKVVALKTAWMRAFPEMNDYFELCKGELGPREDAVVELPFSKMLRRVRTFNQLCNSYFQSLAAVGALRALCETSRRCYTDPDSALFGSRICNFIHDEELLEVPDDGRLNVVSIELKELMEEQFNACTPDYPVEVEPVAMRYWSKKAYPIFNERGELTPWPE